MLLFFRIFGWDNFKTNGWKIAKLAMILATLLEAALVMIFPGYFRITRVLRPFFLAEHIQVLRGRISLIFRTIYKMPEFFFLMLFFVLFYSLMAFTLFSGNPNDPYFSDLFESFLNIFILQTTANYPDVTIPAVKQNSLASLFFISFLMIQLYFIFNLNIATVFNNYKEELENKKVSTYVRNRVAILAAFRMLDYEGKGYIESSTWVMLFLKIRPWSTEKKAMSKFENEDKEKTGRVSLLQFIRLCDVILVKIGNPLLKGQEKKVTRWMTFPKIRKIIDHKAFKFSIIALIFLSCLLVVLELSLEDFRHPFWSRFVEPLLIVVFGGEMVLKFLGYGFTEFIKRKWNVYDSITVAISALGYILNLAQIPQLKCTYNQPLQQAEHCANSCLFFLYKIPQHLLSLLV